MSRKKLLAKVLGKSFDSSKQLCLNNDPNFILNQEQEKGILANVIKKEISRQEFVWILEITKQVSIDINFKFKNVFEKTKSIKLLFQNIIAKIFIKLI